MPINASASDYKMIERTVRQMDRQPVQVDIEATIAEVTLTPNPVADIGKRSSETGAARKGVLERV